MEEQEHNSRIRRNMNWRDGSVLVNCGIQNWGTCFSTICKLELLSEVTLSFFSLKCGGKLKQLLFLVQNCYKTVHKLFLTELCTFMTGWGLSFVSQVSLPGNHLFLGKIFSLQDLGLLRTRVTEYSSGCFIPWKSAFIQFRRFPCFGAL